jgi:hypothetical protein
LDDLVSIVLVVFAALFGFIASILLWQLQERKKKQNIVRAFQIEIKRLKPIINQTYSLLKKYEPPKYSGGGDVQNSENYDIYKRIKKLHLYSESGNWYILKKDIYSLNPQLCENLDVFYYNLIESEELRVKYLDACPCDRKDEYIGPLTDHIENVVNVLPKLDNLLN